MTESAENKMIDEELTFEKYGYYSTDLKPKSGKRVVTVCDDCGAIRYLKKCDYRDFCNICISKTEETRRNRSAGQKNKTPVTDKTRKRMSVARRKRPPHSEKTKLKMSVSGKNRPPRSQEWCDNISKSKKGIKATDETRLKMSIMRSGKKVGKYTEERCQQISAGKQGIPFDEWTEFVRDGEYCHKFNEEIKEYIRNKYNRLCYVCDKNENTNGRKLDVHHTDLNKNQGCDEHEWRLVPLCRSCHSSAHADPLKSRIEYLRADEECAHV